MSLFVNKDKTLKTPIALITFSMAIVFSFIYGLLYAFLTEPLHTYVKVGNEISSSIIHSIIIALIGTIFCMIFFLLPDKRIVPGAFGFMSLFLVIAYLLIFLLESNTRSIIAYAVSLYALAPVILGNIVSWSIFYYKYLRNSVAD